MHLARCSSELLWCAALFCTYQLSHTEIISEPGGLLSSCEQRVLSQSHKRHSPLPIECQTTDVRVGANRPTAPAAMLRMPTYGTVSSRGLGPIAADCAFEGACGGRFEVLSRRM